LEPASIAFRTGLKESFAEARAPVTTHDEMLATLEKRADEMVDDDYLDALGDLDLAPRMLYPTGRYRRTNRFARSLYRSEMSDSAASE
jgi:hypothetical protein